MSQTLRDFFGTYGRSGGQDQHPAGHFFCIGQQQAGVGEVGSGTAPSGGSPAKNSAGPGPSRHEALSIIHFEKALPLSRPLRSQYTGNCSVPPCSKQAS